MRKWCIIVISVVISASAVRWSYGADYTTIDVVLAIQTVNVEGVFTSINIAAPAGGSKVSTRAIIRNPLILGAGNEDFSLRVASQTGTWTLYTNTGAVPQNNYRLKGIWAVYNATLTLSSFDDNDIITASDQISSAIRFFSDTGSSANVGTPAEQGGFNIVPGGERSIFFRFDAGAAGTTGSATASVSVTGSAAN